MRRALLICLTALLMAAMPAAAAGPPLVGGETIATWTGKAFEMRVIPGTGKVTWLMLTAAYRCNGKYVREKPFIPTDDHKVGAHRRLRFRETYDGLRVNLRFSANWTRVTGTIRAAWTGNGQRCSIRPHRVKAQRVPPEHAFAWGTFAGTTSQGLPVSFKIRPAPRYGEIEYDILGFTVGVRYTCTDGTTVDRTLAQDFQDTLTAHGGTYFTRVAAAALPGSNEALSEYVEGALTGRTATGKLTSTVGIDTPDPDDDDIECTTGDLTLSASTS